ncbi:MAG TPA: TetR/AcrR family transcriptional regulator [Gemmatimonadaceae bacterium]|nr:TetR/AcrR family transcriptional regulator [Gemmatimonadaceae bacterium]
MTTEAKPAATWRILDAARALVQRGGAAQVSMGEVAAAAGVSKALVHYHFHDKDSLLCALVEHVGFGVLARAEDAVTGHDDGHALDNYWAWLEHELRGGDLRILLALAEYDSDRVRAETRRILDRRREATAAHVDQIFARLGLNPRVPGALIADTVLAFTDGLAMSSALEPDRDPRPAFDVLWLALLTLAE